MRSGYWLGLQSHANLKMYNRASDDGFGNPFPFSQVVFQMYCEFVQTVDRTPLFRHLTPKIS